MRHRPQPSFFAPRQVSALPAVILAVVSLATTAAAFDTQSVGTGANAIHDFSMSCSSGRALTGVQVGYGPTAVGRVRATCQTIDADGHWVHGGVVTTGWSPVTGSAETTNTMILDCPPDFAVSGLAARLSGSTVNALQLECRTLGAAGALQLSGPTAQVATSSWAGPPGAGQPTPTVSCGGTPGRAIEGRSRDHVRQLWLECATPSVVPGQAGQNIPSATYPISGGAIATLLSHAQSMGYGFSSQPIIGGSTCQKYQIHQMGVIGPPSPILAAIPDGKCRFVFLANRALTPPWRIVQVDIGEVPRTADAVTSELSQPPQQTSPDGVFSGRFAIDVQANQPEMVTFISRIVLEGPEQRDWREAFERPR